MAVIEVNNPFPNGDMLVVKIPFKRTVSDDRLNEIKVKISEFLDKIINKEE